MLQESLRGTDAAKIVLLIRTRALKGKGVKEDPFYEVSQYWTLDGRLLWEDGPDTDVSFFERREHQQLEKQVRSQYMRPSP